jgi:hypothetical protein
VDRFVGRAMLIGLAGGALAGAVYGGFGDVPVREAGRPVAAVAMAFAGALPGLVLGMFLGLVTALSADLFDKVAGRRPRITGGFIVPGPVAVYYCGCCRQVQEAADGADCADCGRRAVVWDTSRQSEDEVRRTWEDSHRQ